MRRIVLIDDKHVDVTRTFTLGFTTDVQLFKMSDVLQLTEDQRINLFSGLGSGDAVMIWGPAGFEFMRSMYHFGIRSENYFDCSLLNRLGMDGGCFAKIYHENDDPQPQDIKYFLSPEFTKVRDFSYVQLKVIKTFPEAKTFLEYFYNQPLGTYIGFDYETSGMPMETYFKIAGAALAIHNASGYFSFLDIEKNNPDQFEEFKRLFAAVLEKHQRSIWVFNLQFEQQVTWREFGIECAFRDSGVFNVLDGLHSKNYSLKWTAQRLLGGGDTQTPKGGSVEIHDLGGIEPWDTDFDKLETIFDEMYFMTVQNPDVRGKKGLQKVLKVSPISYQETPEWDEVCQRYPNHIEEFKALILENFGNQFLNIPSDILGHYCCLDAFYTVQIALESKDRYSEVCVDTFASNMSLGARLHRGGLYVNTEFRDSYDRYCDAMMFWGILYASSYRCKYKMEQHGKGVEKRLKKYNPICRVLLAREEFHNGDPLEITKDILAKNVDENDLTEDGTGLDCGKLYDTYGEQFTDSLIDIVRESMTETKFKGKIDSSIVRKKKILGVISEKLTALLGLDKIDLGKKHEELEKFLFYEKGYNECLRLWSEIGNDINNLPEVVVVFGKEMTLDQAANFLMENYYRCTSPVDNSAITEELLERFGTESVFLASIYKESNKLEGDNKYYENLGLKNPRDAYMHFMEHWQVYWKLSGGGKHGFAWPEGYISPYPLDLYFTAMNYWGNLMKEDKVADIWESFDGWDVQSSFFGDQVKAEMDLMKLPYSPSDHDLDVFIQMRKFLINILLFKKYNKIKTTYINGLFKNNAKYVIDTPNLMPLRDADPNEPGAVLKLFPKFEIMKKETKRWSSGFHTIPSHMDLKEAVTTPPGFMMSYFDISSAEIRTLAFRSGDQNLIDLFKKGIDVYIYVAKQHLGEDTWEALGKSEKKKWRKRMKVVFLAIAYRMSSKTLGEQLNIPENQAQALIDTLFAQFPDLRTFIEYNAAYPEKHEGFINQELGDTLRCSTWRFVNYRDSSGRMRVDKGKLSKVSRAGINYKIQSFSALALANGFNHVVERAREVKIPMTNIIVVHDSSENLFGVNHVFDIKKYYEKEFMEYCYGLYGIEFKFDLMVSGSGYEGFVELKDAGPGQIEICGSGSNIISFLNKIDNESDLKVTTDIPREDIKPLMMTDAIERFISERGCCMIKDTSYYNVKLTKLN